MAGSAFFTTLATKFGVGVIELILFRWVKPVSNPERTGQYYGAVVHVQSDNS